jgi:heptosyltransferase-3
MKIADAHSIEILVRKILVIQTGDIGDVIWSIPTLIALKAAYPDAALFILTREPFGDLLADDPVVEEVFQTGPAGVTAQMKRLMNLRRKHFDVLFDLRADSRGTVMAYLAKSKMKCALFYPGMSLRNHVFTHLITEPPPRERKYGASMQSLRIVQGFGIPETTYAPRLIVADATRQRALDLLHSEKLTSDKAWISVNPFSRWTYKEWGMDKWCELAAGIWERHGLPAVLVGSAAERERAEDLKKHARSPVYNFAGRTTLPEMAAVLSLGRLHIGVDSAAPHIAAAVGTPTIAIYGPTNWRDWVLPDGLTRVVASDMPCAPCYQKGCNGRGISRCLDDLSVDEVMAVLTDALVGRKSMDKP